MDIAELLGMLASEDAPKSREDHVKEITKDIFLFFENVKSMDDAQTLAEEYVDDDDLTLDALLERELGFEVPVNAAKDAVSIVEHGVQMTERRWKTLIESHRDLKKHQDVAEEKLAALKAQAEPIMAAYNDVHDAMQKTMTEVCKKWAIEDGLPPIGQKGSDA